MSKNFRNVTVLANVETSEGVAETLTGATHAMLTKGTSPVPYNGSRVSRDLDRATLGAQSEINTGPYMTASFAVELAGSGTAGTAPKWGPLLRACGFSETISAGVSVTYAPASSSLKSATIEVWRDGQKYQLIGSRGNVAFSLVRGQIPMMQFTFTGKYTRPTDSTHPTPTTTGFTTPVAVTKANTPTFSLASYSAFCEAVTLDMGNQIVYRNLIGSESILLTDRNARGNVVIEAPAIGTKDYFAIAESHAGVTLSAISVVHGTTAGNICTLAGPKVQLASISEQNSDGILAYSMDTIWTPDSGNDECTLVLT